MLIQTELFAQAAAGPEISMAPGFRYQEDFITKAEEAALVASLRTLELEPFEFRGYRGNRRVASFGIRYNFTHRVMESAQIFPAFLSGLAERVAQFAKRGIEEFRQCGVNEYPPGAGIGWHKDKSQFGVVVGISLLATAKMRLRRPRNGAGWSRASHPLGPRSIYILEGEARSLWEHSIPPVRALRYSVTFRTIAA